MASVPVPAPRMAVRFCAAAVSRAGTS
ncbi:hypothetical protein GBAR_LOCUS10866 [Geodia barretti]|uniref:Uncharacterized protein n=1 Tax=Geodia barretti TaxID=519541 RepID=A0AA35RUI6_GEOBA|nr:hypothetical protein GBAR_LOCUS10866 [Geodia barretti]